MIAALVLAAAPEVLFRDIRAEACGVNGCARTCFHLSDVRCTDRFASVKISCEHVHAHGRVG